AREHVRPDRDGVGGQVLPDALVDPLIAATQKSHLPFPCQLTCEGIVELAPRGGQQDDALSLTAFPVGSVQRRVYGVNPEHHARSAAVGGVVDLTAAERRRLAVVEEANLRAELERVGDVPLAEKPLEPLGEEGEDVNPQ